MAGHKPALTTGCFLALSRCALDPCQPHAAGIVACEELSSRRG